MRRPLVLLALLIAAILGALAAKSVLIDLPSVRTHNAPGEFDAARARARLAFVLGDQRPHAADTPGDDQVRARIVAVLTGMGIQPIVRDQLACNELFKARGVSCARVHNVIARIGPASGRALLINAHYDSVTAGPGASDDGAGVASMLEVAWLLKNQPLTRPIVFLFNEGEELGLVGARAFLADPLSRGVDSLVNLEARGVRGPANMFETSQPNGPPIAAFGQAVAHPVANSLSTDVYRLLPNYTDVNSFSERGWLTLNIAMIGNETRYHSAGDNLAAQDPRSLQHMGDQTLALARTLTGGAPQATGRRIFMDLDGQMLVAIPLIAGVVVLAALLIAFGFISWRRGSTGRGVVAVAGTIVASAALAWLCIAVVGLLRPGMFWRAYPVWTHLGCYALTILVALVLLRRTRAEVRQLRAAFWLVYLLIGALIALVAPGGIIFFLFPPLVMLIGMLAARFSPIAERVGALAAIVLLYLTWGEMLALLEELLNQGPMWIFASLGALIILPVLIEAKPLIAVVRLRESAAAAAVAALGLWIAAGAAPAYSADREQRFIIEHVTQADGLAVWAIASDGARLPAAYRRLAHWRWDKLPFSERKRWLAPAPPVPGLKPPSIELLTQKPAPNGRVVVVRLHANGAQSIDLLAGEKSDIIAAGVAGFVRPIDRSIKDQKYDLQCFGRACDGLQLEIVTGSKQPIEFTIVGSSPGLPSSAAQLLAGRPPNARPQYSPDETISLASAWL